MRAMLACAALFVAAAVSCGGKVFVDSPGQGQGGAGGATTTTTGSTTISTGDVNPCMPGGCSGSSDGSCACTAVCNNQNLEIDCQPITGGLACVCIENGVAIAKCQQTVDSACDFLAGCCATSFFGH